MHQQRERRPSHQSFCNIFSLNTCYFLIIYSRTGHSLLFKTERDTICENIKLNNISREENKKKRAEFALSIFNADEWLRPLAYSIGGRRARSLSICEQVSQSKRNQVSDQFSLGDSELKHSNIDFWIYLKKKAILSSVRGALTTSSRPNRTKTIYPVVDCYG